MKYGMMCVVLLCSVLLGCNAHAARGRILVVHSYHRGLSWVQQCDRGIASVFASDYALETVYLDTKRIPESQFQNRTEAAMEVFVRFHPDLVMLGDDNALRLLGPKIARTGTPVVFFGINDNPRKYFASIPDNVTGLLERVPLFSWIRHLKDIMPTATRALVLMDESPTARAIVAGTFGNWENVLIDGVRVDYKSVGSWARWQQAVLGAADVDFITMPLYHSLKNEDGASVDVEAVVRWTSANSPVPVFAYQDYAVGDDGVVGAFVIFGETHGSRAAQLARDILESLSPRVPPAFMDEEGRFYFNRKQLKRFGLTLPAGIEKQAVFQ